MNQKNCKKNDIRDECFKYCICTGDHVCNKDVSKVKIKKQESEKTSRSDSIHSGESLFKSFVFEPSYNSSEMEKCLAFWKEVLDKELKPLKCTLMEEDSTTKSKSNISKKKAKCTCSEKSAKSKTKKEYCSFTPKIWENIWQDLLDKKLAIKKADRFTEKFHRCTGQNPAVTSESIVALNEWRSVNKSKKVCGNMIELDEVAIKEKLTKAAEKYKNPEVEHSTTELHCENTVKKQNSKIPYNKIQIKSTIGNDSKKCYCDYNAAPEKNNTSTKKKKSKKNSCSCGCKIEDCCCQKSMEDQIDKNKKHKKISPCKSCKGKCNLGKCRCKEIFKKNLEEQQKTTNIQERKVCTCGCEEVDCTCRDITTAGKELGEYIKQKSQLNRKKKPCPCDCKVDDCLCQEFEIPCKKNNEIPKENKCLCACGLPPDECICITVDELVAGKKKKLSSLDKGVILCPNAAPIEDVKEEKKMCGCGCALEDCMCALLDDIDLDQSVNRENILCKCGCNLEACICSIYNEKISKIVHKECTCQCKVLDCTCKKVSSNFKTNIKDVLIPPVRNICTCGCNLENCKCSILNQCNKCGCNYESCACPMSPTYKQQEDKDLICLCGCKVVDCLCSKDDIKLKDICPCGCNIETCDCCALQAKTDDMVKQELVTKACSCGCGLSECCCMKYPPEKDICCGCGLVTCICDLLKEYGTEPEPQKVANQNAGEECPLICCCSCGMEHCICTLINEEIDKVLPTDTEIMKEYKECQCGCKVGNCICGLSKPILKKTTNKKVKRKTKISKKTKKVCPCSCNRVDCTCLVKPINEQQVEITETKSPQLCLCGCGVQGCCCRRLEEIEKSGCTCACGVEQCCCVKFERARKQKVEKLKIDLENFENICRCGCKTKDCICKKLVSEDIGQLCALQELYETKEQIIGDPLNYAALRKQIRSFKKCGCECNVNSCNCCDTLHTNLGVKESDSFTNSKDVKSRLVLSNRVCRFCKKNNCSCENFYLSGEMENHPFYRHIHSM